MRSVFHMCMGGATCLGLALYVGCGSNDLQKLDIQKPVIARFDATPNPFPEGNGTNLVWEVTGATSLSIDQGVGSVTGRSSRAVFPTGTTTYTLTATNAVGSTTRPLLVTMTPATTSEPRIVRFEASPNPSTAGQNPTLTWEVTGATAVSIDQGIGNVTGTTSRVVSPTETTTYTLTASNAGQSVTRPLVVTKTSTTTPAPVIVRYGASPTTITKGQSSTLSWEVTGATSLSIDHGVGNVLGRTSQQVTPTETTTYRLTASAGEGTQPLTRDVTVTVTTGTTPPTTAIKPAEPPAGGPETPWLRTQGSKIYLNDQVWVGRGMNVQDARAGYDTQQGPRQIVFDAPKVKAFHNAATDSYLGSDGQMHPGWGADFLRIPMGTHRGDEGNFIEFDDYRNHTIDIINNLANKRVGPNKDRPVYAMLSIWRDPAVVMSSEVPTTHVTGPDTDSKYTIEDLWVAISTVFYKYPYVIYGIINEPHNQSDESVAWQRFNEVVQAIRDNEDKMAKELGQSEPYRHIIAVQGLNNYARKLDYYITHPITAGGGKNIVYEGRVYDYPNGSTTGFSFERLFINPSKTLPVIIGEFGPAGSEYMLPEHLSPMMEAAEKAQVPYTAWYWCARDIFPYLLSRADVRQVNSTTYSIDIAPSADFGQYLKDRLAQPVKPPTP